MRLLFLDCAPFMGGAQESLWTLLRELRRQTPHEPVLACACPELADRAASERIPVTRLPQTRHWRATPVGLLQLLQDRRRAAPLLAALRRDVRPHLVHLNTCRAALLCPELGPDCIIHDRDIRMPGVVPAWLARRRPAVIAISAAVARKWQGRLEPVVIPNMFDLAALSAAASRAVRPSSPLPTIVLAADFVSWKGHETLLDALAELHRRGLGFRAILRGRVRDCAGAALLAHVEARLRADGLSEQVEVRSESGSALGELAAADVVVSASRNEPFGRTVVEALALGKVVVALSSGGVTDILAGCPAATLVGSGESLAEALAWWLPAERRTAAVASAARARAERYGVAAVLPQVLRLYERLSPA
ncbi:MAG: glycosyltransferase family 4 protein [Oligosphaeraceae bacterium]